MKNIFLATTIVLETEKLLLISMATIFRETNSFTLQVAYQSKLSLKNLNQTDKVFCRTLVTMYILCSIKKVTDPSIRVKDSSELCFLIFIAICHDIT